jgi:prepilin signal peptidase PulO-like enzyme (type II secretory pathway)
VVIRDEDQCYVCGDRAPKRLQAAAKRRPVSPLTNVVFVASLAFTAYCFFGEHKLSLPMTLAISSTLLLIRIVAERIASKDAN